MQPTTKTSQIFDINQLFQVKLYSVLESYGDYLIVAQSDVIDFLKSLQIGKVKLFCFVEKTSDHDTFSFRVDYRIQLADNSKNFVEVISTAIDAYLSQSPILASNVAENATS